MYEKLEEVDLVRKVANGVYFINPLAVWRDQQKLESLLFLSI